MKLRTLLKPLSFLPAIAMMYIIFTFSAQEGDISSQTSYKVSYTVVSTANDVFDANLENWQVADYAQRFNGVFRKIAHMTEYFVLAVAVAFPLYVYGIRGIWLMLMAGIICVGFASADEYHQSFVAGRDASMKDVLIDSAGVFFGILLVRFIGWTGRMTMLQADSEKQYSNGFDDGYRRGLEQARRDEYARAKNDLKIREKEEAAQRKRDKKADEAKAREEERIRQEMTYAEWAGKVVEEDSDLPYDENAEDLSDDMPLFRFLKRK